MAGPLVLYISDDFHPAKLESENPTKLHSLHLGNQRLWCDVPLIYLKILLRILKWDSLGDTWNQTRMHMLNIILVLLAVK